MTTDSHSTTTPSYPLLLKNRSDFKVSANTYQTNDLFFEETQQFRV